MHALTLTYYLPVPELPFAGVGESGCEFLLHLGAQRMFLTLNPVTDGNQVMKHTYDTFTQLRSSIDMPKE
jgi:aldehyde dehydrogenase (NAD+)